MGNDINIYLDNAAATPIDSDVMDFFNASCRKHYANQEAIHYAGYAVRKELEKAERIILNALTEKPEKNSLLWTNSGTDSINAALALPQFSRGNIITTKAEHPALLQAVLRCAGKNNTRFAPLSEDGGIDMEKLSKLIDKNTSLIAIHHAQSETGRIQDLTKIREILDRAKSKALFLADTVQSACKIQIPWEEARLDLALISGHKIGAPAGGAVISRKGKIYEGLKKIRDERYLISRTAPAESLTLAHAAEKLSADKQIQEKASELSKYLREKISERFPELSLTIKPENSSPFITHLTTGARQGAALVRMLSEKGIMLSSGSACMAESPKPSEALLAMGMSRIKAYSALRISIWKDSKAESIEIFLDCLKDVLENY
jgi:cysteine desulfurase